MRTWCPRRASSAIRRGRVGAGFDGDPGGRHASEPMAGFARRVHRQPRFLDDRPSAVNRAQAAVAVAEVDAARHPRHVARADRRGRRPRSPSSWSRPSCLLPSGDKSSLLDGDPQVPAVGPALPSHDPR